MRMPTRRAAVTAACLAAAAFPVLGTTSAHADRCEPTEPVVRVLYPTYEEAFNEADSPFCYVMLNYVYPRLCTDSQTLLPGRGGNPGCLRTISPDPYEPVQVYPYAPDAGRIACNGANFVLFVAGGSPVC